MTARRPLALVVAGLVAGVALTGTGVVELLDRDGARPATATGKAGVALSAEGRELVGLLEKGLEATYHARYQSVLADPRAEGTRMTMDVWRRGALTRQEVAVQAQTTRTRTATFQLPPQTFQCSQVGDNPWSCKPPSDAKAITPPEAEIREELGRGAIKARDESIAGVPVRCFTFPAGGDLSETCLMKDGALARMTTASSRFDLVAFSSAVTDDAFVLPAAAG